MIKGADISKWQGQINFDIFRNAVDFVMIRSSYGNGYKDEKFETNRDEARRCNMLRGFYHYAYPNQNTPEAEADWFLKTIGQPQDGEILALDFEESYPDPVNWCLKFLDRVSARLSGYRPLLYINMDLNNRFDFTPVIKANYGVWLARWDYNASAPAPKTDWPVVAMRQYSNHEKFNGIAVDTDGDVFYGEQETFKAYGFKTPYVEVPPEDQFVKVAITILKEFQLNTTNSDGSMAFGNIEAAMRALVSTFLDYGRIRDDFEKYKLGENERVNQLVEAERIKIENEYKDLLLSTREQLKALQEDKLASVDWHILLHYGWVNFWAERRGQK